MGSTIAEARDALSLLEPSVKRGYHLLFSRRIVFSAITSRKTRFGVHSFSHAESDIPQQLTFKDHGGLIIHFPEMFRGISMSFAISMQKLIADLVSPNSFGNESLFNIFVKC